VPAFSRTAANGEVPLLNRYGQSLLDPIEHVSNCHPLRPVISIGYPMAADIGLVTVTSVFETPSCSAQLPQPANVSNSETAAYQPANQRAFALMTSATNAGHGFGENAIPTCRIRLGWLLPYGCGPGRRALDFGREKFRRRVGRG